MRDLAPALVWHCDGCDGGLADACGTLGSVCRIDAELVVWRLEQAGATLLAMRGASPYPAGAGSAWPEVWREAIEAYGWTEEPVRPAIPDAAAITRMDATFAWLPLIPQERYVLRRLVAVRALVHPLSGRHLVTWRRLGRIVGADHHAVKRWHAKGIDAICDKLRG